MSAAGFDGSEGGFRSLCKGVDHDRFQFFAAPNSFGAAGGLLRLRLG